MIVDPSITANSLLPKIERLFNLSAAKIARLDKRWNPDDGTSVFTVNGDYTTRGWTEWTQGFVHGSALLQYDATGDESFLHMGRRGTHQVMASHVSHIGVHDHGFNNVSTYGTLRRLIREGRAASAECDLDFCDLALKVSGAVQAARWTKTTTGGFIYSFNGPHSLFVDTIRSVRSLAVAHRLGHRLMAEGDRPISLLQRLIEHADATAAFNVYFGEQRDIYDVPGRVVHEAIFNVVDGVFRCPSTQQGYSAFTTWTRGLAWAMLGFAEQLEFLATVPDAELEAFGGRQAIVQRYERAARVTAEFYINSATSSDGIPFWDTGAPGLIHMEGYQSRPADPFNCHEPLDASAAAITAQGLLRLGHYLADSSPADASRYRAAGLTVASTLFDEPYLSTNTEHEGLLLHVIYHRPNGWDHIPDGSKIPHGESAMWGDYHLRELALGILRETRGQPYLTFFGDL